MTREEEINEASKMYESVAHDPYRSITESFKAGAHWSDIHNKAEASELLKSNARKIETLEEKVMDLEQKLQETERIARDALSSAISSSGAWG